MDPKKKRLYIIIISLCVVVSIIVILWGRGSTPSLPTLSTPAVQQGTAVSKAVAPKPGLDGSFPAPAVFPNNSKIDASVLDSSIFKTLKSYTPLQLYKGDLGRDNPFNRY